MYQLCLVLLLQLSLASDTGHGGGWTANFLYGEDSFAGNEAQQSLVQSKFSNVGYYCYQRNPEEDEANVGRGSYKVSGKRQVLSSIWKAEDFSDGWRGGVSAGQPSPTRASSYLH